MKIKHLLYTLVLITLALLVPTTAHAQGPNNDKVLFGGNYTLEKGQTLHGDLVIFAGNAVLEEESTVNGDVAVIGGNLEVNATVNGDLVGLGGYVNVLPEATVNGDLTVLGSSIDRAEEAQITGSMMSAEDFPFEFDSSFFKPTRSTDLSGWRFALSPVLSLFWFFFRLLVWTGLAALVFLFLEDQIKNVSRSAFDHPGVSLAAGLGVIILSPAVLLTLLITVILIPISFVAAFIIAAGWILGWLALGYELGRRMASALEQNWSPLVMAALGTFAVMLIFNGFHQIMPACLGWVPKFVAGSWMIGAVALTRFGSRRYTPGDQVPAPTPPSTNEGEKGPETDQEKSSP